MASLPRHRIGEEVPCGAEPWPARCSPIDGPQGIDAGDVLPDGGVTSPACHPGQGDQVRLGSRTARARRIPGATSASLPVGRPGWRGPRAPSPITERS